MTQIKQSCVAVVCTFCIISCVQTKAGQDTQNHIKHKVEEEFLNGIERLEILEDKTSALSDQSHENIHESHIHSSKHNHQSHYDSSEHNHENLDQLSENDLEDYDNFSEKDHGGHVHSSEHDHSSEHNHDIRDAKKDDDILWSWLVNSDNATIYEYDHSHDHEEIHDHDVSEHTHSEHDHSHDHEDIHSLDVSEHDHSEHDHSENDNSGHNPTKDHSNDFAEKNENVANQQNNDHQHDTLLHESEVGWWDWLVPSDVVTADSSIIKSVSHDDHGHNQNHGDEKNSSMKSLTTSVWLTSLASIFVISLVGLASVAAIPLLKGPHQDSLLQLLVSLAIGTLVGDALIHLLPHALETRHGDTSAVWKGFLATMTIIVLFVLDQVMEMIGHGHTHGHGHVDNNDSHEDDLYLTRSLDEKNDNTDCESGSIEEKEKLSFKTIDSDSPPPSYCEACGIGHHHGHGHVDNNESQGDNTECETGSIEEKEKLSFKTIDSDSCPPSYCEQFEKDATTPNPAHSMSSSAMMVIVGDAIHNFADGLAIGAAFSISIAAGFSTSLAVLCHELPHEVGDFALLIHSGMPTKTAVFFNIVSSIFAVFGMIVGLLLGSTGQFSSWLLASTVGVFIYVALVSMMSEIGGGGVKNLILNTGGMVGGAVLLLMIGLYEHDLIFLFGGDNH